MIFKLVIATTVAVFVINTGSALAKTNRKWPTPPSWWINSRDMRAVRTIESGNGRYSHNLYGITAPAWAEIRRYVLSGSAWQASYAEQHYAAWMLYKKFGSCHAVWGVWDGAC